MKFFFAPLDICGLYAGYASGLRDIGHEAEFLDRGNPENSFWDDRDSGFLVRLAAFLSRFTENAEKKNTWYLWPAWKINGIFQRLLVVWVAVSFDVIVLKSGQTITGKSFEPWLYKRFGRKIIVTFHGSDARPPFLAPKVNATTPRDLLELTRSTRRQVDAAGAIADIVVANPLSAHFLNGRCCVYQCLGNVVAPRKTVRADTENANRDAPSENAEGRPIRIVHAPSAAALKGTGEIRRFIQDLRSEGESIDYIELTGRGNSEVVEALASADLAIDQLYSDVYAAVFAHEALHAGRPVIVGGYGASHLDRFTPPQARAPTLFVHPDEFKAAILRLVRDPTERAAMRGRALAYARDFSDHRAAARRMATLAQGNAPESWFFDPSDIRYVEGVAGPRERIRERIKELVEHFGPTALCLDDKPELRDALIAFAESTDEPRSRQVAIDRKSSMRSTRRRKASP